MRYSKGFSLLELLIVLTIIAVLGAVSYPSYKKFMLEYKRSSAHSALIQSKGIITEYLVLHNLTTLTEHDLDQVNIPNKSINRNYNIQLELTDKGYQLTAQVIGKQQEDQSCSQIILDHLGNRYGKTFSGDNNDLCW